MARRSGAQEPDAVPQPAPPDPSLCAACGADTISFIRQVWARRTRRFLNLSFCESCESFMMPANYQPSSAELEKTIAFHDSILPRNREWSVLMWDHLLAAHDIRHGVAEIGCGNGAALAEARSRGLPALGFELNPHVAAFARERCGVEVREALWSADTEMPQVDVLLCLSVLEHLEQPIALASEMARYAARHGALCVFHVPLVREEHWKHVVRPAGRDSPFRSTDEHVVYFSPRGMRRFLERAGFTHVERHNAGRWRLHIARV